MRIPSKNGSSILTMPSILLICGVIGSIYCVISKTNHYLAVWLPFIIMTSFIILVYLLIVGISSLDDYFKKKFKI
jgi:hypothetical protein